MKKLASLILTFVILTMVVLSASACAKTEYTAAAEFYYSADKGHTYGNMTKEYNVGEAVYMRVIVKVMSSDTSGKKDDIGVRITIPNATGFDGKYLDGQIVTPQNDAVAGITYYDFTVEASSVAEEHTFVFCFVPNQESEVAITLVFDDNVNSKYDRQNTIIFVEPDGNAAE